MLRRSYYPLSNPQTVTVTTTSGVEASRPTTPAAFEGGNVNVNVISPRSEEPWHDANNHNINMSDLQTGTPPAISEKEYR